ncbi:hypothetical protein ACLB2K_054449 [Fragaria x ananassa]
MMNCRILVWNCRGIVGGARRRALVDLIRQEKPRILFLSETLCSEKQPETLRIRIGFDNCLGMASSESSPGVALLWMNDMPVNIQTYSARHIDVSIDAQGSPEEWRLSGIYGYARTGDRGRTWELMRRLARQSLLPWLLVGDFNEILANSEKVGGAPRRLAQMQAFRETLMDCALLDMGYSGSPFTWADHQTKERLDRSLWSVGLRNLFPRSSTTHLHPSTSDHSPLLVEICVNPSPSMRKKRIFRFEQFWATHPECEDVIKGSWGRIVSGNLVNQAIGKIKHTCSALNAWQKPTFMFKQAEMRAVRSRLDELMAALFDPTHHAEKQALNKKFQELLTAEETIWIQRSKALWLKDGDRNTAYFHHRASNRKQRNSLKGLCNVAGERVTDRKDIESVVTSYYSSLFSTDGVNPMALNLILDSVQARVTPAQNHELLSPYMDCEVKAALFQMHPSKAPGPDGMSPFFFQKYWHVVGPDVCTAVKSFLSSGALPAELNFTHKTLISKVSDPKSMAERWHTFCMHTNRTAANDHFSLKLDISKAYDRLEWEYIRRILLKLGFAIEWVNLIMTTLNTVSYSFMVNGEVCGFLKPKRGIRQGDPLSPYLFILCGEGLSSLIQQFVRNQWITGMQIAPTAPTLHHLLFADDSLFFSKATEEECQQYQNILYTYEIASGQRVNLQKSCVAFSRHMNMDKQLELAEILGVERVEKHDRYLGLPTHVGRKQTASFNYLKKKLTKKVVSWRAKLLSGAGKEILIKAVAQTVPMYVMNCYLLPIGFCDDLHQLCAGLWWGDTEEKNKIHWRSWERLCVPKHEAELGSRPSFSWRSILSAREVLTQGLRWRVGTGDQIDIWNHKWIPDSFPRCPSSPPPRDAPKLVAELIDPITRTWDIQKLERCFSSADVDLILSIPLSRRPIADKLIWHFHKKGIFTTKSAYFVAKDIVIGTILTPPTPVDPMCKLWKAIWNAKVPGKVAIHTWRSCANILPTRANLLRKGYEGEMSCLMCNHILEDNMHLFLHCPYAQETWSTASIPNNAANHVNLQDWLLTLVGTVTKDVFAKVLIIMWSIWKNRNTQLWENKRQRPSEAALLSLGWLTEFTAINTSSLGTTVGRQKKWEKPRHGWYKCNCDGAFVTDIHRGGSGVVIRDEHGQFRAGAGKVLVQVTSPFHAELITLLEGLKLAETLHISKIVFETDCLLLQQAVSQPDTDLSTLGTIIAEVKEFLHRYADFRILHVPREANRVAHILANHALNYSESQSWFVVAPEFVRDVILSDCSH